MKGIRGVALYVKSNISSTQIYIENEAADTVWVEIKIEKNQNMLIGGIYKSHNNSHENNVTMEHN